MSFGKRLVHPFDNWLTDHLRTRKRNTIMQKMQTQINDVQARIQSQFDEVHRQVDDALTGLNSRLAAIEQAHTLFSHELGTATVTSNMLLRLRLFSNRFQMDSLSSPHPTMKAEPFESYLERFKSLYPHLYDTWASVNFGKNIEEFKCRPECSCAVDERPDARLFSGFIAPYLQRRVLDVGCGPYATPIYLRNYPADLISGIDPLEPFEPHPFEFVRGFAEFLPWHNDTFDVVVAATSLDHTLDLEAAFSEIRRVLIPGGYLLVWEWFGESAEPYRPKEKSPELVDQFHLFNFDEKWFEESVKDHFIIVEKLRLYGEQSHYRFYSLKLYRK